MLWPTRAGPVKSLVFRLGLAWGSLIDIFTNPEKFSGGEHFFWHPYKPPAQPISTITTHCLRFTPPPAAHQQALHLVGVSRDAADSTVIVKIADTNRLISLGSKRRDEIPTRGVVFILQLRLSHRHLAAI